MYRVLAKKQSVVVEEMLYSLSNLDAYEWVWIDLS